MERTGFTKKRIYQTIIGLCLSLLVAFAFHRFIPQHALQTKPTTSLSPLPHVASNRFSRTLVEDLRLNGAPGAAAFPLMELGACRVEKPRIGGFRLGVGDVLEFDRLELNLPLDLTVRGTNTNQHVDGFLSRALDLSSFRRMANINTAVSSATIASLRISLVQGTNRVAILTASSARITGRSNIALRNCVFLDNNLHSVEAAKARLTNEHGWRITADNSPSVEIETVAKAVQRLNVESSPPADSRLSNSANPQ